MIFKYAQIRFVVALFLAYFVSFSICAETNAVTVKTEIIQLKNGDRLTGIVVKEDGTSLNLKTPWQSEVVLPKAEILKRETPPPTVVPPPNPVVALANPVPAVNTNTAVLPKPKGVFKGNIQLGADLRDSSVQSYLYTAAIKLNYAEGNWHNALDYRYSYGKTDNLLSADRMDGTIKTDLDIGQQKKWFFYALAGAGYDTVRKINMQLEFGPGIGRHLLTRTNMTLSAETGLSYQRQDFSNADHRDEIRLRLAADYNWRLSSKFSLETKAEIQPSVDSPDDYRIRYETSISYALWNNISWNVALIDLYDSKPTAGVTRNDLQIRSGIGIKF